MYYPKILTIQDISCVGQCSLTVALPIISACGIETCVLPSAVLSTHTYGFQNYTFRDLTQDMPDIYHHWEKEGICFDGIYTGYLGSAEQIAYVKQIITKLRKPGAPVIVDPAMADNGKLYPAFDNAYVQAMKRLCCDADYLIPNITEACFLTDTEYKAEYDEEYINLLLKRLSAMGCKNVILTGISYESGKTGVVVYDGVEALYYAHNKLPNSCHGTGDIYASAFTAALLKGKPAFTAAKVAADYTVRCIETTGSLNNHWYGAAFELELPYLIQCICD